MSRTSPRSHGSITVISYVEWALGSTRAGPTQNVLTRIDADTRRAVRQQSGADRFRQPRRVLRPGRATAIQHRQSPRIPGSQWIDGRSRRRAVVHRVDRAQWQGAGSLLRLCRDAGAGSRAHREELVFVLGQAADEAAARLLVRKYRALDPGIALARVQARWNEMLGAIQIRTPDRALDLLFNRWLLYQTAGCRMWGRAAFYQAGGAFGFRDQLQDSMALTLCAPAQVRAHLLRSAARQFVEGDVQHWWHPPSGRGVRTHFSDDRVWLPFAAHHYIRTTGDAAVLDEVIAVHRRTRTAAGSGGCAVRSRNFRHAGQPV